MSDDEKKEKDFFSIVELSELFRQHDTEGLLNTPERLAQWQIRCLLAVAQQLAVISKHINEGKKE